MIFPTDSTWAELIAHYHGVPVKEEPELVPVICPEVHNARPVDADECMKAVRDFARSHQ